jgi:CBS domain-containing protein
MKISEVMTSDVETVKPNQIHQGGRRLHAARDAGSIPVCDGELLQGMITDRDIAVRAVAEGLGPDTPVTEIMTSDVLYAFEDDDIQDVAAQMSKAQVRRCRWSARGQEAGRHRLARRPQRRGRA